MLKKFYPSEYVDSVFSIDYEKLYNKGYHGLIFDIDNTLVHHGDDSTEKVDNLFKSIKEIGFNTLLLSNNNEERVTRFNKNIGSLYICDAEKPKTKNYEKAVEMLNMKKSEVLVIGDQLFTDILGANKSNMDSILVKFIRQKNETSIGKRRKLENLILRFYVKNRTAYNKIGDITKKGEEENVI